MERGIPLSKSSGSGAGGWRRALRRWAGRRGCTFEGRERGFTLIEMLVVLTIILILATMSMPLFQNAIKHAREAVLKDDLYTLRKLIDEYTQDKQQAPAALDDLVQAGYLRTIPVDPFTGSSDTWRTDVEDVPTGGTAAQASAGIVDVHSGSDEQALDGTAYSSW